MADLRRTVLISGCSSGIGLELAVQLAHDSRQRYQGKEPRAGLRGQEWVQRPGPSAPLALFPLALPFQLLLWARGGPRTHGGPLPTSPHESSPHLMTFLEPLLDAMHCSRSWVYSCEQNRPKSLSWLVV